MCPLSRQPWTDRGRGPRRHPVPPIARQVPALRRGQSRTLVFSGCGYSILVFKIVSGQAPELPRGAAQCPGNGVGLRRGRPVVAHGSGRRDVSSVGGGQRSARRGRAGVFRLWFMALWWKSLLNRSGKRLVLSELPVTHPTSALWCCYGFYVFVSCRSMKSGEATCARIGF